MKKFLKVFIIVLLVIAVIAGTCFFFFKRIEKRNNTTESLAILLVGEVNKKFNEDLAVIKTIANEDRIDVIVQTNKNLDKILYSLVTFHIENNFKINDKEISKAVDSLNTSRGVLSSMMKEYNIKKDNEYFNKQLGINDFYKQSCAYFVNYAQLIKLVNNELNVDRMADSKYNLCEIYANVVIDSFSSTNANVVQNAPIEIINSANIDLMNLSFKSKEQLFQTSDRFDTDVNNFNYYYANCNKMLFVSELSTNVQNVNTPNQSTNEKIATYYFKLIYGI